MDQYLDALRSLDPKASAAFEQSLADDARLAAAKQKRDSRRELLLHEERERILKQKVQPRKAVHQLDEGEEYDEDEETNDKPPQVVDSDNYIVTARSARAAEPSSRPPAGRRQELPPQQTHGYDEDEDNNIYPVTSVESRKKSSSKFDAPASKSSPLTSGRSNFSVEDNNDGRISKISPAAAALDRRSKVEDVAVEDISSGSSPSPVIRHRTVERFEVDDIPEDESLLPAKPIQVDTFQPSSRAVRVIPEIFDTSSVLENEEIVAAVPHKAAPVAVAPSSSSSWTSASTLKARQTPTPTLPIDTVIVDKEKEFGLAANTWTNTRASSVMSATAMSVDSLTFEPGSGSAPSGRTSSRSPAPVEQEIEPDVVPFEDSLSASDIQLGSNVRPVKPAPVGGVRIMGSTPPLQSQSQSLTQQQQQVQAATTYRRKSRFNFDDDSDSEDAVSSSPAPQRTSPLVVDKAPVSQRVVEDADSVQRNTVSVSKPAVTSVDTAVPKPVAAPLADLKSYFGGGRSRRDSEDGEDPYDDPYSHDTFERDLSKLSANSYGRDYYDNDDVHSYNYGRPPTNDNFSSQAKSPSLQVRVDESDVVSIDASAALSRTAPLPSTVPLNNSRPFSSSNRASTYSNVQSTGGVNGSWDYKQQARDEDDVFERSGNLNYFEDSASAVLSTIHDSRNDIGPSRQSPPHLLPQRQLSGSKSTDHLDSSVEIDTSMSVILDMDLLEAQSKQQNSRPPQSLYQQSKTSSSSSSGSKDGYYARPPPLDDDYDDNIAPGNRRRDRDDHDDVIRSSVMDYLNQPKEEDVRRFSRNQTVSNQRDDYDSKFGQYYENNVNTSNKSLRRAMSTDNDEDHVLLGTAHFSTGSRSGGLQGTQSTHYSDDFESHDPHSKAAADHAVSMDVSWENDESPLRRKESPPTSVQPDKGEITGDDGVTEWIPGRASLDLIETAKALDVFVSSLRLDVDEEEYELPQVSSVEYFLLGIVNSRLILLYRIFG
jgi:hypothetical protein